MRQFELKKFQLIRPGEPTLNIEAETYEIKTMPHAPDIQKVLFYGPKNQTINHTWRNGYKVVEVDSE